MPALHSILWLKCFISITVNVDVFFEPMSFITLHIKCDHRDAFHNARSLVKVIINVSTLMIMVFTSLSKMFIIG